MGKMVWSLLLLFLSMAAASGIGAEQQTPADDPQVHDQLMYPSMDTLRKWHESHASLPAAPMDEAVLERLKELRLRGVGSKADLLEYLSYVPKERNQKQCGNCWVWAATGIMEIAKTVQDSKKDRFSIQLLDSCKMDEWACYGGTLVEFSSWYEAFGYAIPWGNRNARFQDQKGYQACGGEHSKRSCEDIADDETYPIKSITPYRILTSNVGQEKAIDNIKAVLSQEKAVFLRMGLPTRADWRRFTKFWNETTEDKIWHPEGVCGKTWLPSDCDNDVKEGAWHAMLVVGYDDTSTDPDQHYWLVLNSWGTGKTGNRPSGIFRLSMNLDYDCVYVYGSEQFHATAWGTADIQFGAYEGIDLLTKEQPHSEPWTDKTVQRSLLMPGRLFAYDTVKKEWVVAAEALQTPVHFSYSDGVVKRNRKYRLDLYNRALQEDQLLRSILFQVAKDGSVKILNGQNTTAEIDGTIAVLTSQFERYKAEALTQADGFERLPLTAWNAWFYASGHNFSEVGYAGTRANDKCCDYGTEGCDQAHSGNSAFVGFQNGVPASMFGLCGESFITGSSGRGSVTTSAEAYLHAKTGYYYVPHFHSKGSANVEFKIPRWGESMHIHPLAGVQCAGTAVVPQQCSAMLKSTVQTYNYGLLGTADMSYEAVCPDDIHTWIFVAPKKGWPLVPSGYQSGAIHVDLKKAVITCAPGVGYEGFEEGVIK